MKFAKELENDLVPEWRAKYFNYKLGKKKIKAVSKALKNASRTPQQSGRPDISRAPSEEQLPFTYYDFTKRSQRKGDGVQPHSPGPPARSMASQQVPRKPRGRRDSITMFAQSPPVMPNENQLDELEQVEEAEDESDGSSDSDNSRNDEQRPLQDRYPDGTPLTPRRYGSISATPPSGSPPTEVLTALQLPDPALDPAKAKTSGAQGISWNSTTVRSPRGLKRTDSDPTGIQSKDETKRRQLASLPNLSKKIFKRSGTRNDDPNSTKMKMRRAFTTFAMDSPGMSVSQFEAYRELDARQDDFFTFLDRELNKIESFYKSKEDEATARLMVLRDQLHELRDRRLQDLREANKLGKIADDSFLDTQDLDAGAPASEYTNGDAKTQKFFEPVLGMFNQNGKIGRTSEIREELSSPRGPLAKDNKANDRGDYVRKQKPQTKVPYRNAKRKLKLALQEFYRGLELLKSFALLNRTAFRKINKKYDKAAMARPPLRYLSEKVNVSHFVQSNLIEETLVHVEDLYARYFERGNRKVAVSKLRSHLQQGDRSGNAFRNGLFIAAGVGLAASGLVRGTPYLFSDDPTVRVQTSYLYQIYAGYFMAVLLFLCFVIDCRIWQQNRINYVFVFEYDTRHVLDYRQLAELPCFFLFLNGLFFWINFELHHYTRMFLYWPVVLVGLTAIIICLPFRIVYYRARKWFLYSNWRLFFAGLYPVEFRDFFFGDMYCSETYTMSQLEVFFCLYVHDWNNPPQCNSNNSRLLGFLTTLPAVWRAFQCLRRYYDSRNWFPHLANFAKYCCNILYYMTLSLYRIDRSDQMRAVFIAFAIVNGTYCAFWDVFMDFSLGNPWSKNFLLRDHLAFRRKWVYYAVMVVDIILRQQWIFYAIFTDDLQHSAAMSFFVAILEIIRRGVWSLFRVENEHCNNVLKFRAFRDIPLPYTVAGSRGNSLDYTRQSDVGRQSIDSVGRNSAKPPLMGEAPPAPPSTTDGADLERAPTNTSSIRRRGAVSTTALGLRALQRVSTAIAEAHAQDFEKRRMPELMDRSPEGAHIVGRDWSDDEDNDAEDDAEIRQQALQAAHANMRSQQHLDHIPEVDSDPDRISPHRPRHHHHHHRHNEHGTNNAETPTNTGSSSGNRSVRTNSDPPQPSSRPLSRSGIPSERQERDASIMGNVEPENVDIGSVIRDRFTRWGRRRA